MAKYTNSEDKYKKDGLAFDLDVRVIKSTTYCLFINFIRYIYVSVWVGMYLIMCI